MALIGNPCAVIANLPAVISNLPDVIANLPVVIVNLRHFHLLWLQIRCFAPFVIANAPPLTCEPVRITGLLYIRPTVARAAS